MSRRLTWIQICVAVTGRVGVALRVWNFGQKLSLKLESEDSLMQMSYWI